MQLVMKLRTKCLLSLQLFNIHSAGDGFATGTVNNIFATNIVKLTLTKQGSFLDRIQENWKTEQACGAEDNLN